MRWPLRNQIFVPVAVLLALSVVLVTVVSAWHSAKAQRDRRLRHMESVAVALGDAEFPLYPDVVTRLSGMVDGDVVVLDRRGNVTASTLPRDEELATRLRGLTPTDAETFAPDSVVWRGQEYLVAAIERTRGSRPGTLCVLVPQTEFAEIVQDSVFLPLMVAVPTLVLALIIAMVVARRVGGRIGRLQRLFGRLAAGDFQTVAAGAGNDEVGDLLNSANELSAELRRMQSDLVRAERLELLGQLSGGLAHQLRNSITGARLAIQLHEQQCSDENTEMLETALAQLRLTEEQVLAVLSLRENVESPGPAVTTDLEEMVRDVVALLRPQTSHWQSDISMKMIGDDFSLKLMSPGSMKGALLNIVMNAVEAAGVSGRIQLRVFAEPQRVCVDVRDSGPGFSSDSDDLTAAFRTTKAGGIGLGLTIARHAVEQEMGALSVRRDDGWTSVRIDVPRQSPATLAAEVGS